MATKTENLQTRPVGRRIPSKKAKPFKATRTAGPTASIAGLVSSLHIQHLPQPVVERAKDLVLDYIGVTLCGAQTPWSQQVRDIVMEEGGKAQSRVFGGSRLPARAAALANGAAAHAVELDDTHDESLSHPGAVILSAAFAVAEARACSGSELLTAMVAGYEAQCRIGLALGRALQLAGWHPTATLGVFGAAAAAGNLLGLNQGQMVSAFGSAGSMASGVMQFTEDPVGTTIKRLHAGLPAERGVFAAQLAAKGFAGPHESVEGRWGFAKTFTGVSDLSRMTEALGERYEIERISVKLYACCKLFHSLIEAIAACREDHAFKPEDVLAIEPFGPSHMIDSHMEYRPQSMMAAQYSLPFVCAVAIMMDPALPASFSDQAMADSAVLRMTDRVKPVVDKALEAMFPRRFPGGVRIKLRGGTVLSRTVLDSRSSPDLPIGRSEIQEKFLAVTQGLMSPKRQIRVMEMVTHLDRVAHVGELAALLK